MYRENALPKSTARWVTYNGTRPSVYAVVLLQLLFAAITASATYARIRSQPPERIVRVEVPGPVRVVEVPALPPPRCVASATPLLLRSDTAPTRCPNDGVVNVVPGDHDNFVVVECHCPRTP